MRHKKYISTAIDHPDPTSTPCCSYKNTQQTPLMCQNSDVEPCEDKEKVKNAPFEVFKGYQVRLLLTIALR